MLPKKEILLRQRLQLGLIHLAVAMTLVPINSTLNRVMIKELALSATLVAVLASLPYLFSPIQVAIGSFADRHPLFGMHRTPYIVAGLLLCVLGVIISPYAAFAMAENFWGGLALGVLAFGAWGMGYNLSAVSYLSLASELSGEKGRSRTVAVMFFMMITSIILTAIALSHMVDPYTPQALLRAFWVVGLVALGLGLLGILRLEPRREAGHVCRGCALHLGGHAARRARQPPGSLFLLVPDHPAGCHPGAGHPARAVRREAFGMTVRETTRITAIWGSCMLAALAVSRSAGKPHQQTQCGALGRSGGAGWFHPDRCQRHQPFAGCVLRRDRPVGDWHRLIHRLEPVLDAGYDGRRQRRAVHRRLGYGQCPLPPAGLGDGRGAARHCISRQSRDPLVGYLVVFSLMALMLLASLVMLRQINVRDFRQRAEQMSVVDRAAHELNKSAGG